MRLFGNYLSLEFTLPLFGQITNLNSQWEAFKSDLDAMTTLRLPKPIRDSLGWIVDKLNALSFVPWAGEAVGYLDDALDWEIRVFTVVEPILSVTLDPAFGVLSYLSEIEPFAWLIKALEGVVGSLLSFLPIKDYNGRTYFNEVVGFEKDYSLFGSISEVDPDDTSDDDTGDDEPTWFEGDVVDWGHDPK